MKQYFIKYPRNFNNEYSLRWAEKNSAEAAEAIESGYEPITRKAANDIFKLFSKLPDSEMVETVRLLKDSQTKKIFEKFSENA